MRTATAAAAAIGGMLLMEGATMSTAKAAPLAERQELAGWGLGGRKLASRELAMQQGKMVPNAMMESLSRICARGDGASG